MSTSQSKKKNPALTVVLMCIIATILIIVFLVVALIIAYKITIPEFEITDQNGEWTAQGEIAVFDNKINPGSEGEYKFIIKNDSGEKLKYGFKLSEQIGSNNEVSPFMQYRLKMDNIPLDDEWHYAGVDYSDIEILSGSKHLMTLEWRWPFESGNDINDTLIGSTQGQLSVHMSLWAEIIW